VKSETIAKAEHRQLVGFLNTAEDLITHLGHRMLLQLPAVLVLVLRIVEQGVSGLEDEEAAGEEAAGEEKAPKEGEEDPEDADSAGDEATTAAKTLAARKKELRATGLRLLAKSMARFPEVRSKET
jgi:hypothetical protein